MGMSKTTLARVISVSKYALSDQVRAILNKYNATMLLPGVSGVLRFGYQPGNYTDSAGTILAAANDGVGRVDDAAFGGFNATQSTAGFKPVLRNTSGIQSWQFDSAMSQRLSLSAVPFQMADDHFVVVGATAGSLANNIDLFAQRSSAAINPILLMRVAATTGAVQAIYRDDAGTLVTINSAGGATVGTPFVGAMRQVSGVRNTWRDLSTGTNNSTSLGATTFNNAAIGASLPSTPIGFHSGHIHGVIFGKGSISDSELLTLERFVASLQGRAL